MSLIVSAPINSLSFGYVSYQILNELFKRNISVNFFPTGNTDASTFDKATPEFKAWLDDAASGASARYKKDEKEISIWHVQNSERKIGGSKNLLTFFELSKTTDTEKNILNQQEAVFVSNFYTKEVFERDGINAVFCAPLGFDSTHFQIKPRNKFLEDRTVWAICGKAEIRKQTSRTIKLWLAKYGNNSKHILHLSVFNPFWSPEQNQVFLNEAFGNKKYFNVNILPYTKTLSEYSSVLSACDIIMDLSVGEGFSIPSFTATALGKHCIACDCAGISTWANDSNSVLVKPSGMEPAIDNVFFSGHGDYNVGDWFKWETEAFYEGMEKVLARKENNIVNEAGLKLATDFTWQKTVDIILENMK